MKVIDCDYQNSHEVMITVEDDTGKRFRGCVDSEYYKEYEQETKKGKEK